MRGTPLTHMEAVASMRRQYERNRALGMDHANAIVVLANRHSLDPERVEHFCPPHAGEQRVTKVLELVA